MLHENVEIVGRHGALRPDNNLTTGHRSAGPRGARPDHAARGAAHVRLAATDSGAEREGGVGVHGPLDDPDHFDIYGHVLPGSRDEVRERMDAYLARPPAVTTAS
jgi:hypothetical protein